MSDRLLTAEAITAIGYRTIQAFMRNGTAPTPTAVIPVMMGYGVLGVVAMFGSGAASVAGAIGGLMLMAILFADVIAKRFTFPMATAGNVQSSIIPGVNAE